MSAGEELHYMSVMSVEVHGETYSIGGLIVVNTRGTLLPNPEEDSVNCIFWCVQTPQYKTNAPSVETSAR